MTATEATVGMALDTVGVCGALFQSSLRRRSIFPRSKPLCVKRVCVGALKGPGGGPA